MLNIKISVIIPFYNGSLALLDKALLSIAEMNCQNIEVVIVDDGSETPLGIHTLSGAILPFDVKIYRHSENQGIAVARNTAVNHSTGDWLLWLDCDDTIDAHCIEKMEQVLHDNTLMAIGECYVYENDQVSLRKPSIFFNLAQEYSGTAFDPFAINVFSLQPQLVRKTAFIEAGEFDPRYRFAEMTEFVLRFISRFGTENIEMVEGSYYHYNRNMPDSVSQNRLELEKFRLLALREYARTNNMPVDDIIYIGRCNLGTQVYAPVKDGKLLLPPYTNLKTNNLIIGE